MAKNKRQPYAVSEKAGEQTSAESWGTGEKNSTQDDISHLTKLNQGELSHVFPESREVVHTEPVKQLLVINVDLAACLLPPKCGEDGMNASIFVRSQHTLK